jgi:hypothetical protein
VSSRRGWRKVVVAAIEQIWAVVDRFLRGRSSRGEQLANMSEIQGEYDHRFSALRDLFQENLDAGEDLDASIAVVRNGFSWSICGADGLTLSMGRHG